MSQVTVAGVALWILGMAGSAFAVGSGESAPEILVRSVEGEVYVVEPGIDQPTDAFESMSLGVGARIQTGENSTCSLLIGDVAIVDLEPQTVFKIPEVDANAQNVSQIEIEYGGLWTLVEKLGEGQSFEVMTRTAIGGVRGTQFRVHQPRNDEAEGSFSMMEGELELMDRRTRKSLVGRLMAGREARMGPRGQFRGEHPFDREGLRKRFARFVRDRKEMGGFRQWKRGVLNGEGSPEIREKLREWKERKREGGGRPGLMQDLQQKGQDMKQRTIERLKEKREQREDKAPRGRPGRDGRSSIQPPGAGNPGGARSGSLSDPAVRDDWLGGGTTKGRELMRTRNVTPVTRGRPGAGKVRIQRALDRIKTR